MLQLELSRPKVRRVFLGQQIIAVAQSHSPTPPLLAGNFKGAIVNNGPLVRALTALVILYIGPATHAQRVVDEGTVIENVTLISPERGAPLLRVDVVLRDGRIAEIGRNLVPGPHARRINGSGRFLIPGLIDSHVHAGHSAALDHDAIDGHPELWAEYREHVSRAYLAFGFTSVVDLDLKLSDRTWFESAPLHPHLYSCGGISKSGTLVGAFKVGRISHTHFASRISVRLYKLIFTLR